MENSLREKIINIIETELNIKFNDKDILERRFDFLDNIVAAVQEKVENVV